MMIHRDDIVAEALTWCGTPYRHQGSIKGVGCDCLGLVRGVWRNVIGPEPAPVPAYTADWAESCGIEQLAEAGRRYLVAKAVEEAESGDVVLFRLRRGLPAKHAAILVSTDHFVHAYDRADVVVSPMSNWWRRRIAYMFAFPGVID